MPKQKRDPALKQKQVGLADNASADDLGTRVREALRADSRTRAYADHIIIDNRDGTVILRGEVEDIVDEDNLLAVAMYVAGVHEVVDRIDVRH